MVFNCEVESVHEKVYNWHYMDIISSEPQPVGMIVGTMTVLDVKIGIKLVVSHVILGITVVLEVIIISLVVIVASKDGTIELVVINIIDGTILVLVVNKASTVEAVSDNYTVKM